MKIIQVLGRRVPYDVFLDELSERIADHLERNRQYPEFVSQRKAYDIFGRANVDRWRQQGIVTLYRRPGKVEYKTEELRQLKLTEQDYFDFPPVVKGKRHKLSHK